MAQTQETTWNFGPNFATDTWIPVVKDVFSAQMKTAQMMFDTTAKLSQTFADFYQSQASEGLKLSQACFQTGKTLSEEVRRQYTTLAEKAVRPQA